MLLSMSPRRSWRSMLTSFACEQIVQVRATEQLQRRRTCRSTVRIYSGTGSGAQPRKRAQYRGGNAPVALLQFRVLRLGLLQDGDVGVGVFPKGSEITAAGPSGAAGRRSGDRNASRT